MKAAIAVVTPVYNGENSIQKAINSLLAQSFTNWVNIIVNDGSTDGTSHILKKYQKDDRFIILNFKENKGRPHARQAALDKIRKLDIKYMAMLDADDWYYPDKLDFQYKFMEENPGVALLSMSIGLRSKNNVLYRVLEPYNTEKHLFFQSYDKYKTVPHASSLLRVRTVESICFDLSMKYSEDQDFMRRFLINNKYVFIPKVSYIYNRDESFSYQKYMKSKKSFLRSINKSSISRFKKIFIILKERVKVLFLYFLFKFNRQDIYLNKMGRQPKIKEVQTFKANAQT
tara:strand:+ start:610 stop:1467 length:858 start_codon:yes stop_codon:yes gene_type:complete